MNILRHDICPQPALVRCQGESCVTVVVGLLLSNVAVAPCPHGRPWPPAHLPVLLLHASSAEAAGRPDVAPVVTARPPLLISGKELSWAAAHNPAHPPTLRLSTTYRQYGYTNILPNTAQLWEETNMHWYWPAATGTRDRVS